VVLEEAEVEAKQGVVALVVDDRVMVRHHPQARSVVVVDRVDVVAEARHPLVPLRTSAELASVAENAAIVRVTVPDAVHRRLAAAPTDRLGLRR
jgi:hypothetical protein